MAAAAKTHRTAAKGAGGRGRAAPRRNSESRVRIMVGGGEHRHRNGVRRSSVSQRGDWRGGQRGWGRAAVHGPGGDPMETGEGREALREGAGEHGRQWRTQKKPCHITEWILGISDKRTWYPHGETVSYSWQAGRNTCFVAWKWYGVDRRALTHLSFFRPIIVRFIFSVWCADTPPLPKWSGRGAFPF